MLYTLSRYLALSWSHYTLSSSHDRLPKQYTIDAFTSKAYKGNSAAVVIMPPSTDFNWDTHFMHNVRTHHPLLALFSLSSLTATAVIEIVLTRPSLSSLSPYTLYALITSPCLSLSISIPTI